MSKASIIPDLLTAAAEKYPGRPALVMDDRTLTYAELESASNRFARSLVERGVNKGDRVLLWMPKSIDAIVAIYGAMKAGACYVPVDPGAPAARLAFIASDCRAAALVTAGDRLKKVDEAISGKTLFRSIWSVGGHVDFDLRMSRAVVSWKSLEQQDDREIGDRPNEDDLAYILYTSGTTGEPKGVMIEHRASLAFVEWARSTFAISAEDRVANHAPLQFDLSTFDLFASASAGAAVYPVPPRMASFPAAVAALWTEQQLTVWYVTPSTLVLMLSRGNLAALDLSSLRVLLFAGEVMPAKVLRELMRLAPQARFANLYGPTETNVCTWYEVLTPPEPDDSLPIGMACAGTEIYVLDENQHHAADDGVGELWVHGPTMMRGYWERAELTSRVLRQIEMRPGVSNDCYRTGDLVRMRSDGNLEFMGRSDHQVKTRGYRVELGEIEEVLRRHPQVDEAVVVAVPDPEVANRLHAAVALKNGAATRESDLKRHCAATLPRYMVPETIEVRSDLPRTSSGKLDRQRLLNEFTTLTRSQ